MTEDQLEQETLGWLADVGYRPLHGPTIAGRRAPGAQQLSAGVAAGAAA